MAFKRMDSDFASLLGVLRNRSDNWALSPRVSSKPDRTAFLLITPRLRQLTPYMPFFIPHLC